MRKQVQVEVNDLFNLQPSLRETILAQLKKDGRTTQSITAKKCKCSLYGARSNLERLVSDGLAKDLGVHTVNSRNCKVYEAIK